MNAISTASHRSGELMKDKTKRIDSKTRSRVTTKKREGENDREGGGELGEAYHGVILKPSMEPSLVSPQHTKLSEQALCSLPFCSQTHTETHA